MSCALTTGFALDCKDAIGGVKSIRFGTVASWSALSATVNSSGEVTAIGSASTVFYKYAALKETSMLTEPMVATTATGGLHYTPQVTIVLSRLSTAKRNEIRLLAKNRLVAIVELMQEESVGVSEYYVVGVSNGLELTEGVSGSGTAAADLNGYTLTFSGIEPAPMLKLQPSSGTVAQMLSSITNAAGQ